MVAPRDERGLKRLVDPAVLDFRQRMMFDPRKNRRESTSEVIRRKEKMRALGKDSSKDFSNFNERDEFGCPF